MACYDLRGAQRLDTVRRVEAAIRSRGTNPFSGPELARELNCCRQTIYAAIRVLVEAGHRIEGQPKLGFMARMIGEDA